MLQPAKSVMHYTIFCALLNAKSAQDDLRRRAFREDWKHAEELHDYRFDEAVSAFEAFKETLSEYDRNLLYGYVRHRNIIDKSERDSISAASAAASAAALTRGAA